MAKTAQRSTGNSPLAALASKATTESATAPRTPRVGQHITGQYLLNKFVTEKDETSKLDIIKNLIQNVDVATLKKVTNDMVDLAKQLDRDAGIAEADITKGAPNYKTASNNRTVIQKVYGAMRFASEELKSFGFNDSMGYHATSAIAKKALDIKHIKWTGEVAKSQEEKERAKQFRDESAALKEVQTQNPRKADETLIEWNNRTLGMVAGKLEELDRERHSEMIAQAVQDLIDTYGTDDAVAICTACLATVNEVETV